MWKFKPSKYKNAAPTVPKKPEGWITDFSVGTWNSSGNGIQCSAEFVAFNIDAGGGGCLGISNVNDFASGRQLPVLNAHSDFVSDFDFCPYDDGVLATCSYDHHVKLWRMENAKELPSNPLMNLLSQNPVEAIRFNPSVDSVLATADANQIRLWDINSEKQIYGNEQHGDTIQGIGWKIDGSVLASISKDKSLRIWDARNPDLSQVTASHAQNRDGRVLWLGYSNHLLTTGFGSRREREIFVHDVRNLGEPIYTYSGESSVGILIPLFDSDTNMLFLVAKTESAVTFSEVLDKDPFIQTNSKFHCGIVANGAALVPKRGLNVMNGEVNRVVILGQTDVVPLSYTVLRKSYREFHADLFPDTLAAEPTVTISQWTAGEVAKPQTVNLNPASNKKKPITKFNHKFGSGPQSQMPTVQVEIVPSPKVCSKPEVPFKPPLAPKPMSPAQMRKNDYKATSNTSDVQQMKNLNLSQSNNENELVRKIPAPQRPTISFGIRSSKFRHLDGNILLNETRITDLSSLTKTVPGESDGFQTNKDYFALPLGVGGGLVAIIPVGKKGRAQSLADISGVLCGTKCLDFVWDPFNTHRLVTACDTGDIQVWDISTEHLTEKVSVPHFTLNAMSDKVTILKFNPTARDIFCSVGSDTCLYVWDLGSREAKIRLTGHKDQVLAIAWSTDGRRIATVCKDQLVRIFDPRSSTEAVLEGQGPEGIRGARIVWVLNNSHFVVSGFSKVSERQIYLYDCNNVSEPIGNYGLDVSPATLIPHYDEDSSTLFLTGKGDSTVYAFEVATDSPCFHPLSHYKCSGPHQALSFLPKVICNIKEVEFARTLRLTATCIETLSFRVPRLRAEYFQDDIFPDTRIHWEPLLSSTEWLNGKNLPPKYRSLKPDDMTPLSMAPPPVKASSAQKKPVDASAPIAFEGEVVLEGSLAYLQSGKETQELIIESMKSRCQYMEGSLPQDSFDGVDPEEWDEEQS